MLLRSSSSPILSSWLPHSKDSGFRSLPEPEIVPQIAKNCSVSVSSTAASRSHLPVPRCRAKQQGVGLTRRRSDANTLNGFEEREEKGGGVRRTMSLGLAEAEGCWVGARENVGLLGILVGGGGGGKICGGNGGGSDGGDRGANTEMHYQNMIEADPESPLLLSNYAKFLKEVGKLERAEEYCARAILASPNDGNVLSMYADLVWQIHGDAARAETYFDQAVKASPDDCYVQASYAHFLWDTEEDEDEEVEKEVNEEGTNRASAHKMVRGVHPSSPPLAAAA